MLSCLSPPRRRSVTRKRKGVNKMAWQRIARGLACLLAVVWSLGVAAGNLAGDRPPTAQGPGEHSSITVGDGDGGTTSIRDDTFAEMVKNAIQAALDGGGQLPTSVKVFFNSCYGGGMLDDLSKTIVDCFDIPFVGGSASAADEVAWGPSNSSVGTSSRGSYWTDALNGAINGAEDGDTVQDILDDAAANDRAAAGGNLNLDEPETPQVVSANGGSAVTLGPAEVVVFSGNNNRQRHDNNVSNMEETLGILNDEGVYSSSSNGNTQSALQGMLNAAARDVGDGEELVIYVDDHGDTDFDLGEWWNHFTGQSSIVVDPFTGWDSRGPLGEQPGLHPGWNQGLEGNVLQGDTVDPGLVLLPPQLPIEPFILDDFFDVFLNGELIPADILIDPNHPAFLPLPWDLLRPGEMLLQILPDERVPPTGIPPLELIELQLVSGSINALDIFERLLLPGDYDGSGQVEQGDLDLVLRNWGQSGVPLGWINDLPNGIVDQAELDKVLLGWGSTLSPNPGGTPIKLVPEPAALVWVVAVGLVARRRSA